MGKAEVTGLPAGAEYSPEYRAMQAHYERLIASLVANSNAPTPAGTVELCADCHHLWWMVKEDARHRLTNEHYQTCKACEGNRKTLKDEHGNPCSPIRACPATCQEAHAHRLLITEPGYKVRLTTDISIDPVTYPAGFVVVPKDTMETLLAMDAAHQQGLRRAEMALEHPVIPIATLKGDGT